MESSLPLKLFLKAPCSTWAQGLAHGSGFSTLIEITKLKDLDFF